MPTLIELDSLDQQVSLCKKLHLNFIELSMNLPEYIPENLAPQKVKDISKKEKIEFTLHLPDEIDLGSFQKPILDGHLKLCQQAILWSKNAGIKLINTHIKSGTHFTLPHKKVLIYEKYQDTFISTVCNSFDALADLAGRYGVRIHLENGYNFHLPFIRKAVEQLVKIKNVYLTWDTGHDAISGFKEKPILMKYQDKIKHLHLHDYDGKLDHQPLYTGNVNIKEAIEFAQKYNITVLIENKTARALEESVKRLEEEKFI